MNARLTDNIGFAELGLNGKNRPHRTSHRKDQRKNTRRRKLIRAADWRTVNQWIVTFGAGFLPIASYVITHMETEQEPRLWALVAACLVCSAPTLATWANTWTGEKWLGTVKAWGFTVLLEGTMIFSHTEQLRVAGMALLVVINAAFGYRQAQQARLQRGTGKEPGK